jgi:hypothetical protein
MVALDIFICFILFSVSIFIFEVKRRKKIITVSWQRLTLYVLIGLFFAFTYCAFRFFHTPWKAFGFLHAYGLFASFALPFVLAYLCKGTNSAKTVAIIMSVILFLSPITRPIFLPMSREMTSIASWDMAIPFNLCNISAIVFIIAVLTKNKTLLNYMITFGLFGGIINNIQAHNTFAGTFWFYLTWESYFAHFLIISIPIFMLLTGQIKPSIKHSAVNCIWIFPFFLLCGFLINPLWRTNFHFTSPIAFTKAFLPTLENPLEIFGSAVDPLYMGVLMIAVAAICVILYGISIFIYKYARPKFYST